MPYLLAVANRAFLSFRTAGFPLAFQGRLWSLRDRLVMLKYACSAIMLGIALCTVQTGMAQAPTRNAAAFAKAYGEIVERFGGQEAFQASYEEARLQQAHTEGALQISINMEKRLRENGRADAADIYLTTANGLRPVAENLREVFTKFDALDSPIDEARGAAAYERIKAEYASLFERPVVDQFEFSKSHPLKSDPLVAVQAAAETLIAAAESKPG